ncbi:MAG: NAD(P)H-hydrate dehydratase [Planctomycetota bacterium]
MHEDDTTPVHSLPERAADAHKGTAGTVTIVGGCAAAGVRMTGAPALAARAALRAGAGLAKVVAPAPVLGEILTIEPSATGVELPVNTSGEPIGHEAAAIIDEAALGAGCLAVGCGLGTAGTEPVVVRAITQLDAPVVLDADGINSLAQVREFGLDLRAPTVLTPHPGEFDRLTASLGLPGGGRSHEDRAAQASELARHLGCIVVLKGIGTVVTDGLRCWRCDRGHPCLATAGTGDVLTGLIASLIAQYSPASGIPTSPMKPLSLYQAARVGVLAHAIAGEAWAEAHADAGLRAQELADLIPGALRPR